MNSIDFQRASRRLPKELFLALQSVPAEEAARLSKPIDEIDRMDDLSSQAKSYQLGYHLLDLVGKKLLAAVLEDPVRRREYRLHPPPSSANRAPARPNRAREVEQTRQIFTVGERAVAGNTVTREYMKRAASTLYYALFHCSDYQAASGSK
ncbi:MAG: hypothetical protein OXC12_00045 [Spirochaetaceae bacterium]|nr:hypothetical protein [Spirochaetaceae bacterium]